MPICQHLPLGPLFLAKRPLQLQIKIAGAIRIARKIGTPEQSPGMAALKRWTAETPITCGHLTEICAVYVILAFPLHFSAEAVAAGPMASTSDWIGGAGPAHLL